MTVFVPAPPITPRPYGLVSVAFTVDDAEVKWLLPGGIMYQPDACGVAHEDPGACYDDVADLTITDGVPLVMAEPFILYHLFRCKALGLTEQQRNDRAARSLDIGSARAVDLHAAHMLADAVTQDALDDDQAFILGDMSTAVHPVTGLAMLERAMGGLYGGVGVIHSPVDVTTLLTSFGSVIRGAGRLETVQGTPVASLAGGAQDRVPYVVDPTDAPADGTAWLYATGAVMVRRGATVNVAPQMTLATPNNDFVALAERPYVMVWECFTAAVLVRTDYDVPTS